MSVKINLLKKRHTLSETEYQKERTYFRYAMTTLVVAVVITVAISIWQFVLTRKLNGLETRLGVLTQQLVGLSEANAKQIYLKSRLKLITAFLDERTVARQAIQKVFSINIPGVTLASVNFESENVINVQATAENVVDFGNLIDYLNQDSGFFLQIVSRGVTRNQDGRYQMEVALTLPKG